MTRLTAIAVATILVAGCGGEGGGAEGEVSAASVEKLVAAFYTERIAEDAKLSGAGVAVERVDCAPTDSPLRFECTITPTGRLRPTTELFTVSSDGGRLVFSE